MSAVGEDRNAVEIPIRARHGVFVRLEDIPDPDGHAGGLKTRLKPPSAVALRLTRDWERNRQNVELLWDIAETYLPDLTRAQLELLTPETVLQVADMACQPIAELEAIAKNASAPLAEAPKGSKSATPSPTRSRGSRKRTASPSTK